MRTLLGLLRAVVPLAAPAEPYTPKSDAETVQRLKQRVASNLKTTFASAYTKDVSLAQALSREEIAIYSKRATAAKYLVCPNKDL